MSNHPIKKHDLQQVIEEWDGERPGERNIASSMQAADNTDEVIFYDNESDGAWIQIDMDDCVVDDIARDDMMNDASGN